MKPCQTCSADNSDTSNYCTSCGVILVDMSALVPATHSTVTPSPKSTKTNSAAIASLIFAFIGWGLPAVICGHVGQNQCRNSGENGNGIAIAGLTIGYCLLVLSMLFMPFFSLFASMFLNLFSVIASLPLSM